MNKEIKIIEKEINNINKHKRWNAYEQTIIVVYATALILITIITSIAQMNYKILNIQLLNIFLSLLVLFFLIKNIKYAKNNKIYSKLLKEVESLKTSKDN